MYILVERIYDNVDERYYNSIVGQFPDYGRAELVRIAYDKMYGSRTVVVNLNDLIDSVDFQW